MPLQAEVLTTKWLEFAEKQNIYNILTNPIMDIAARFWENERYTAAKNFYQSMRKIDDHIDNRKATGKKLSEIEKQKLIASVNDWIEALNNNTIMDSNHERLLEDIRKFKIPLWPWQMFSKSMIYDVNHNGFETFPIFLKYARGASVAPASIFLHLCGLNKENGHYSAPHFDVREAAEPAGLFCYLVHIVRDFQTDQSNNLNYFVKSLMRDNGLNSSMLKEIASGGEIPTGFRSLIKQYHDLAEEYKHKTRTMINTIDKYLEPQYRLSLEIVYNLYLLVFEKIDVSKGRFTTTEVTPSTEEVKNRLNRTLASFK